MGYAKSRCWKMFSAVIITAIFAAFCQAVPAAAMAFRIGDQGAEVAEFQGQLAALGYDVMADGDYGPSTVEAVKAFQKSLGIEVDGLMGAETYRALMGRALPPVSRGSYVSRRIVQTALQYIGVPYVFGGTSPGGFDCSGYVRFVFQNAGVSLPRAADEQYLIGTPLNFDELRPGDLVFFSTYTYGASHVGIAIGEGKFIHASASRGVIIDSLHVSYWVSTYIGARRVL